jgi:hypothetical protein
LGFQGPQGFQGERGFQGGQGIEGYEGPRGFVGPPGTNGTNGSQGLQGPPGENGTNGPQGFQGFQGFQGNQGIAGTQITSQGTVSQSITIEYYGGGYFNQSTGLSVSTYPYLLISRYYINANSYNVVRIFEIYPYDSFGTWYIYMTIQGVYNSYDYPGTEPNYAVEYYALQ